MEKKKSNKNIEDKNLDQWKLLIEPALQMN